MKKIITYIIAFVAGISFISASCVLDVTLVNQDPYPALPGDYVKVVFQITGLASPECDDANFWIEEKFPFSLDPGVDREVLMKAGTYVKDYKDFFLVPYTLRVHHDALDGESELTTVYSTSSIYENKSFSEKFNITVEDSRTDFEVNIKDYSPLDNKVTFDILNIGENNVQAVTIEIPKQDTAKVLGSNRVIVGDIDSNEEDTFTFKSDLKEGQIKIDVFYTDQIGERRKLEKNIFFDPSYYAYKLEENKTTSPTLIFFIGFAIPVGFIIVRSFFRKKKDKPRRQN